MGRQATGFTLAVAVTQLLIYNGMGGTHGGPGEQIAHFFEFTFAALTNGMAGVQFRRDSTGKLTVFANWKK